MQIQQSQENPRFRLFQIKQGDARSSLIPIEADMLVQRSVFSPVVHHIFALNVPSLMILLLSLTPTKFLFWLQKRNFVGEKICEQQYFKCVSRNSVGRHEADLPMNIELLHKLDFRDLEEGKKEDVFRKICLKSMPFFVEEFHRVRKLAPLYRFLVHGQSSDDKQRPYAKSQVYAVLRRRVPPCVETSTAATFCRLRGRDPSSGQSLCIKAKGAAGTYQIIVLPGLAILAPPCAWAPVAPPYLRHCL
ncbi:hypothetical protein EVAR_54196_1 [Eumeta japonica]|uniref:Uncharacterized protein n=1 Tax=Eumeta variegata TaxID=151549 RepID=A0A4C1YHJ4_EUMVA|nr:hypothetical protein EVAR_54196_1 [Eumeta japonica]